MADSTGQQFGKLPNATKLLLGTLLLLAVAAVYYATLHSPLDEDIQAARRRNLQLQDELQQAQDLQAQFVRLREELQDRKAADRENLRVLPESSEIATVLQDLNRLAELSGLDIQSVQPRPESPEEFYVRIPVSLRVSGRYHQLAKFFHNVSRLQRAINIENISIELADSRTTTASDEDVILTVEVLATTFRRKDEGAKS